MMAKCSECNKQICPSYMECHFCKKDYPFESMKKTNICKNCYEHSEEIEKETTKGEE